MANEEVLGPRKTMFVLVIVVGCFAVLWPRILSPLIVGHTRDKLQPNQFDREAGCCEVMFEKELAVLELINEVCSSAVHVDGKLSAYGAAECRKAVNETCGLDIAAFLKRSDNIGKTSKKLVDMMKSTNSSCLKEHFGVPVVSLGPHLAFNSWTFQDTMKQERNPIRGAGPHPALRERGRAIPPGTPPTPARSNHIQLPPNARVGNSPLAVYFDLDIKPPPIPGMRPPLGSPGGPVPAPKSSMGFVMPIYTICIIVFFVYTISKIFFTRATASPYESVAPDPQFRRRVFRDDSRTTPDKLVVTAISGLVAEVRQQMEAGYEQNQQRQDAQDNQTRPYTNGNVIHNSGPVHIIASEYHEKEKSPELNGKCPQQKEQSPEPKEASPEPKESSPEPKESSPEPKESSPVLKDQSPEPESKNALEQPTNDATENKDEESKEIAEDSQDTKEIVDSKKDKDTVKDHETADEETTPEELTENHKESVHIDLTKPIEVKRNGDVMHKITDDFIKEEVKAEIEDEKTKELLEEAIDEESEEKDDVEQENASVKVMGMELIAHSADGGTFPAASAPAVPPATAPPARTHEAKDVKSIFLETEIPQQSRVLIADFGEDRPKDRAPKHSPMVVSGKMTLSLIQDAPRDTPERDAESTFDDYTTASAVTQNAAEKEGEESDEDLEEEIEIEEIEEEIEVEEEEEEEDEAKKGTE